MKTFKTKYISILLVLMAINMPLVAQEEVEVITDPVILEKLRNIETMQKMLEITRSNNIQISIENTERERKFIEARDQQESLLNDAKKRLQEQEDRSVRLQKEFEDNEKILEEIGETLRIRIGNFGELFGVFRQVTGEVIATVKNSIVSLQFPNREESLTQLAENKGLPTIDQMKSLVVSMLEEMTQSGRVDRFDGQVVLPGGSIADAEIVRVGVFNAITEDFFLKICTRNTNLASSS